MSLTFSAITLADVDVLLPIEDACHSHPWNKKTFTSCIGGRYFGETLCLESTKPIGFYIAEHVLDEATLMDICVLPEHQGSGYGKALLQQCLQQAKQLGATTLWLEVRAKNIGAQMMYINQGFVEKGRRTGYYPSATGFGYEDAIVMSVTL